MKKTLLILPLTIFGFLVSCEDSPEEKIETAKEAAENAAENPEAAAEKMAELQNEFAKILEGVTDTESAKESLGKLEPVIDQMAVFMKTMAKNDTKMDPEVEKKLEGIIQESQKRLDAATKSAMPHFATDPKLQQEMQALFQKMFN